MYKRQALTTALANSFRLREAAAVVASGGDASDDGGDPPHGRRRAGRDVWRGWLVHPVRSYALDALCPTGRWRMREAP